MASGMYFVINKVGEVGDGKNIPICINACSNSIDGMTAQCYQFEIKD